ncbi:MAG: MFS transporter [Campylobacterales bacterium]
MFKTVFPLSSVIAIRFLGLFIVMPTLSVYALGLEGATPFLAGLAISIYALTQMILQTPFGSLSDKIGRKQTIAFGILVFIIGSLIAAFADSVYTLIIGRALQGAGAIGAVVTAMISDLIHEERRTKAMAIMGGTISISFSVALVTGPIIAGSSGTDTLFVIASLLAFISLIILFLAVPNIPKITYGHIESEGAFASSIKNADLRIMFFTGFFQKLLLSTAFVIIPYLAIHHFGFTMDSLYTIYIPATLIGILAMGAGAVFAEKKGRFKEVLSAGAILLMLAFLGFDMYSDTLFFIAVMSFFAGFSMHEPIMQSLASKYPKNSQKGAVLGVFNSFSYFGTFLGGIVGGLMIEASLPYFGFFILAFACLVWIGLIYMLELPKKYKTIYLKTPNIKLESDDINLIEGIREHYSNPSENITVFIFDEGVISEVELERRLLKI